MLGQQPEIGPEGDVPPAASLVVSPEGNLTPDGPPASRLNVLRECEKDSA